MNQYTKLVIIGNNSKTEIWSNDDISIYATERDSDGNGDIESNKSITISDLIQIIANRDDWNVQENNKEIAKLNNELGKKHGEIILLNNKIQAYEKALKTIKGIK